MQFSLGKQYTPISAWRLTGRALVHENIYRKDQHIKYGEVELDYMMNIANLAGGYNDKWYDCSLFAGVAGGVSMQNGEYNVVGGFRAGAQFGINVGAGVTLFVEPSGVVYTKNFDGITYGRKFDAQMQAVAGLKYRFKNGNDTPERGEVAYKKYVQIGRAHV